MVLTESLKAQETTNFLSYSLEQILGITGLNLLGQYELIDKGVVLDTVASIKVDYPLVKSEVVRRFVPESGIEVTITNQPDYVPLKFKRANVQVLKYFTIILDQHSPHGVLDEAIDAMYSQLVLDLQPPTFIPARLKPDHSGVLPSRAIIYLRQNKFLRTKW